MVEAIDIFTNTSTPKRKKHFWQGSRLPSIGCLLTVFSFYDYRAEVKSLLARINKAGLVFFFAHLDNDMTCVAMRKLSFPSAKSHYPIKVEIPG